MKEPYKITSVTLITYAGRSVKVDIETGYLTCSVRLAKEKLLDHFQEWCKKSKDPFVKIESVAIKQLFKKHDRPESISPERLRMRLAQK